MIIRKHMYWLFLITTTYMGVKLHNIFVYKYKSDSFMAVKLTLSFSCLKIVNSVITHILKLKRN